jgi:four helix bundle protein
MSEELRIKTFTDLNAWREAHEFVLMMYRMTKSFPKDELFALVSQIRRASVSITSNIAEGFSRESYSDKKHFYVMAHGSLTEVQNQLIVSRDVHYINDDCFEENYGQSVVVHKLLSGLIKATKERANS